MFYPTIATGTPLIGVIDNRGLSVRALNWNRAQSGDPLRLLVSHSHVDDASRVASHRDPRQFAAWSADDTAPSNLRTTPSLTGQVLRRESSDSGERVTLSDAAGRAVWMRDGRGTVQTVTYDELGRPSSGSEQLSGSSEIRVSWRSEYGDSGPADDGSQGNNLRGVCVTQYDSGGLLRVDSVAVSGAVLSQGQRFLASAEVVPDWPEEETGRAALLEAEIYTTTVTADARGAVLNQTDAAGHAQAWRYDVSSGACHQTVTPAGGEEEILLDKVTRSAAGRVLTESAGNGVTTTYGYDPQNQWLASITARRTDNTTLQALSYGYDFTGNVTSLTDGTVATGYWRNQATDGGRSFTYDALYQLLSASGRENAGNTGMQYSALPAVLPDGSQSVRYSRSYHYDDSGNLTSLSHTGAGSYTRTMTTDTTSNRSVQQNDGGPQTPEEVAGWFDSNGNLLTLQAGATGTDGLLWDGSDNLQQVTLVNRSPDSSQNDREVYQYSGSRRVRRQTRALVNSSRGLWDVDEVRYLPGLELRKSWQETAGSSAAPSLTEELHVVTGQAGRAGIRMLHWESGKPDGIDNNQVRWSVDDNIGSLSLELDAEGQLISREEYYPFGGTAVWAARSEVEAEYKTVRYSGKERDGTGLYYYGHRYYAPWLCRWVSADPAGEVDGLNLYRMVRNNPVTLKDADGRQPTAASSSDDKSPKYMFSPFISATDSLLYDLLHKFYYSNILKKEEEVIKPIFVNKDQERSFNTQMDKEKDLMIIMLENILSEEDQEFKHTQAVDIFNKFKEAYSQEGVFKFPPESSGGTLYISGHGAAGSDSIYPGTSKGSIREKSSYEIVDRLITKGLPEHFNIKMDFCWSGASLEPEDITVEEYQQAFLEGNIFNLVSGEDNSFLDQFADDLKEEIPEFKGTLSGYAGVVHTVKKVDINSHSRDGKPHYMVSLPVSGGSEFFMRKSDARRTITM
ncbi:RHS repeat-associated core domain-containing protein [Pseudescherichia sp.]|uniref:RHS repeat-associated core domain-containing protein n=1 Tax=Pseudescherichia sp. TaxID=2055881 RepID=UPI0028AB1255|nr:RHS repeat-associated core domain-containing protein [Pseudescherichia sp.]